jgi:RHS repeat-associated protein
MRTRLLRPLSAAGRWAVGVAVLGVLALPVAAHGDVQFGDVLDQFFRFTEKENRVQVPQLDGESVDPFSGNLRIVRSDLKLPGKAGLDLEIVRTYSSKVWARADELSDTPLLAEGEHSVLGYGWSLHMGRLRNPGAGGSSGYCGGDFPVYEAPDGSARVFYPLEGSDSEFVSRDYWRMSKGCGAGVCIWSDTGLRYEVSDDPANQFFEGTTPVWPVTLIADPFGNTIGIAYVAATGAVGSIVDTYARRIQFDYDDSGADGRRLTAMTVSGPDGSSHQYQYFYGWHEGGGLPGPRRFLTEVRPPAGPSELYDYAVDVAVADNRFALSVIAYPTGGWTEYTYAPVSFFTGRDMVPFATVSTRRLFAGKDAPPAVWSYSYTAPSPTFDGTDPGAADPGNPYLNTTEILRPDLRIDRYTMVGFGYTVQYQNAHPLEMMTYGVGLTLQKSLADGALVVSSSWGTGAEVSPAYFTAPAYSDNCGPYRVWDAGVFPPVLLSTTVERDGAAFETGSADFDAYGQPQTVVEHGYVGAFGAAPPVWTRETSWSYFHSPPDHLLRGRPLTQHVCIDGECYDQGWTYLGPGHTPDSQTASGVRTVFTYDPVDGELRRVTDAAGKHLDLEHYAFGVPDQVSFGGAITVTREVSWEGWVHGETNGRGYTTQLDYDEAGRLVKVTPPGGSLPTSYEYAPDLSWTRQTHGAYSRTTWLDGLGRSTLTEDTLGTVVEQAYDPMGRVVFQAYPHDGSAPAVGDRLEYDGLGRVVRRTRAYQPATDACDDPHGCVVTTAYDANCVFTTVERSAGTTLPTWHCYASFGDPSEQRLVQVLAADGTSLWNYGYTAHGALRGVTAPLAQGDRSSGYDEHQFQRSEQSGESGLTLFGRNAVGQMTSRVDARGVEADYGHDDPLGRVRSVTYPSAPAESVTFDYDDASNVTAVGSEEGGEYRYAYDELDRVKSQVWTYRGVEYWTTYHYDDTGCLNEMTYPSGLTLDIACDALGRPVSIAAGGEAVVSDVKYHPSGQVGDMTYGNGVTTHVDYDARARVQDIVADGVSELVYGYDGADNVVSREDRLITGSAKQMRYDALDRLTSAGVEGSYYDALGNRTSSRAPVLLWGWYPSSADATYTYDSTTNRLVLAKGIAVPAMRLSWNAAGRLASSSDGASYQYDGNGRRVEKTDAGGTTIYHYDAAGRVIAETTADGTKIIDYVYLGSKLVAADGCIETAGPGCADREYYHADSLGSVIARTDGTAGTRSSIGYLAWGAQDAVSGQAGDRQYNGRVYDPGTGFHDYGARMYWPAIGRFISADSYQGDIASPASLNRYSYVLNNPYRYVDPTGHFQSEAQEAAREAALAGGAATGAGAAGLTILYWVGGAGTAGALGWLAGSWINDNLVGDGIQRWLGDPAENRPGDPALMGPVGGSGESPQGHLVRFGQGPESADDLAEQAARAEAAGFPHGVSTKLVDRVSGSDKDHRSAPRAEVESSFKVEQTGKNPKHHTVHLPKPVTPDVADKFNKTFPPKK